MATNGIVVSYPTSQTEVTEYHGVDRALADLAQRCPSLAGFPEGNDLVREEFRICIQKMPRIGELRNLETLGGGSPNSKTMSVYARGIVTEFVSLG